MNGLLYAVAALVAVACCHRGPAPTGLRLDAAPTCTGPKVEWDDTGRRDAAAVVRAGLAAEFRTNPIAIGGFAEVLDADSTLVVIVPADVEVDLGARVVRAQAPPTPPAHGDAWYWKVEYGARYADGVVIVREQGTVFPDGRVSRTVELACGGIVDDVPVVVGLGGFGT